MTSDVFGERRPESLDGLGYDLTRGSFEEMRVKVAFTTTFEYLSLQNINANLSNFSTSPNDATSFVAVPNGRHLVRMAVKGEQLCSVPGAIAWIHVSERACSVTSRALDVSRDKVLVACFYEGREDMSWYSEQDAQSHTHCVHPHTHFLADKTSTTLVQWCVCDGTHAAASALALVL